MSEVCPPNAGYPINISPFDYGSPVSNRKKTVNVKKVPLSFLKIIRDKCKRISKYSQIIKVYLSSSLSGRCQNFQ